MGLTGICRKIFGDIRGRVFAVLAGIMLVPAPACAAGEPWSLSIYTGPWTQRIFTQIVGDGRYDVNGIMLGAAIDARLFRLGWGFSLAAEGQIIQSVTGHIFTTFAGGLGFQFDEFPWSDRLPTSVSVYTGPSYAVDPPAEWVVYAGRTRPQHSFLNYISIEFAVAIPRSIHWDGVFRIFHRSGAWGVYSINADEGTTLGLGARYRW